MIEGLDIDDDLLEEEAPEELGASPYILPTEFFSHSQVNKWRMCGERYRLEYVEGRKQAGSSNLSHGRLIHAVVEDMLRHKMGTRQVMDLDQAQQAISDKMEDATADLEVWDPKIPNKEVLEDSARALVKLYHEQRLETVRPKAVELRVSGMINGKVPFRGYIDMIEENPMASDEYRGADEGAPLDIRPGDSVVDLKCTGKKYGEHRVRNSLQLTVYAHLTGVEHVGYDLLVETEKTRKRSFVQQVALRPPAEKQHGMDVIEDVAKAVSAGIFPKADPESWGCSPKWCPFYDQCRGRGRSAVAGLEEV